MPHKGTTDPLPTVPRITIYLYQITEPARFQKSRCRRIDGRENSVAQSSVVQRDHDKVFLTHASLPEQSLGVFIGDRTVAVWVSPNMASCVCIINATVKVRSDALACLISILTRSFHVTDRDVILRRGLDC
jgi:hypothetical protein